MFKATNHSKRDGSNYFALKLAGNRNVPFTPHPENPALWAECGVYFYLSQHQDDHGFTRGAPLGFSRLNPVRKDGALTLPFLEGIEALFISSPQ